MDIEIKVNAGDRYMPYDIQRPVGYESRKAYQRRCETGFWDAFITGPWVLDIGHRGGLADAVPIISGAVGIEPGFPDYDGLHLPVQDGTIDTLHASHVLEHVAPGEVYLAEWFRVLRVGGTMILMVPHAHLYERRLTVPPSRWSGEHLRSYTPANLLHEIEWALPPNSYRVRHLADNDDGYDYTLPRDQHPVGCLEIECVIQKITPPTWTVEP